MSNKEYHREYYQKTKERRKILKNSAAKIIRKRNKEYIKEYLEKNPCVDCGESDPVVLEFDHVRDIKEFNISDGVLKRFSLDKIERN